MYFARLASLPRYLRAIGVSTYTNGLLVLLFVGFCALIIVAQLIPALLALFGMTRAIASNSSSKASIAKR